MMSFDEVWELLGGPLAPINIGLLLLCGYLAKKLLEPDPVPVRPKPVEMKRPEPRAFTSSELREYCGKGKDGKYIYLAVRGRVFDVSGKPDMYGEGGPYEVLAGHDASIALAKELLTAEAAEESTPENVGALEGSEKQRLDEWESFFAGKYMEVGWLDGWGKGKAGKTNE